MLQLLGRAEQTGERWGARGKKRRAERGKQVTGAGKGLPLAATSRNDRGCASVSSKVGQGLLSIYLLFVYYYFLNTPYVKCHVEQVYCTCACVYSIVLSIRVRKT